jgi:cytochrome c oxidase cbb3-type subunit 3
MKTIAILSFFKPAMLLSVADFFGNNENAAIYIAIYVLLAVIIILALYVTMLSVQLINFLKRKNMESSEDRAYLKAYEEMPFWQRFLGFKPQIVERYQLMGHSYDGITELDNPIPGWFMWLFYGTIGFGAVYWLNYHVLSDGMVQEREYAKAMEEGEQKRQIYLASIANKINENNVTLLDNPKDLEEGKVLFDQNCVACHGTYAEGKIGPNLVDDYWLHGGSVKDVFKVISEGVPAKGMIAWNTQLNPFQIQKVTSYIFSLQGTNPANPKAPQGEKYVPEGKQEEQKGEPAEAQKEDRKQAGIPTTQVSKTAS